MLSVCVFWGLCESTDVGKEAYKEEKAPNLFAESVRDASGALQQGCSGTQSILGPLSLTSSIGTEN